MLRQVIIKKFVRNIIAVATFFELGVTAAGICVRISHEAGLPLPDASINVSGLLDRKLHTTRTGPDGTACIDPLPDGLYSVEAALSGFLCLRYYPVRVAFPRGRTLSVRLPFGDIQEGGINVEAVLSGTLTLNGSPAPPTDICVLQENNDVPNACTKTNDLGQYALSVRPGIYRVEMKPFQSRVQRTKIDMSEPGYYTDKLTLVSPVKLQP